MKCLQTFLVFQFDTAWNFSRFLKRGVILFTKLLSQREWLLTSQEQRGHEQKEETMEIENRGQRKAGGRGQLPDTARLCALQPGRMQMALMLMTPPLWPSVVKGRHSIIQSRSGGELASLHLSSSNGPSTGYQGRWALNKGGITSRYESRLLFWAPRRPLRLQGERGPQENGFHSMHFCK